MEWKEHLYQSYVSSGQVADRGQSAPEHFAHRAPHILKLIDRHFPADHHTRILDIGCGHGALLFFLLQKGYTDVHGVDGSPEQVNLARRLGVPGVCLGEAMAFLHEQPDSSAGVICLFDVLEHLTRNEAFTMVAEIRRVLAPHGLFIGRTPNAQGLFGMNVRYGDLTHEQAFTQHSLSQMLRTMRFSDIACFEDRPAIHGLFSFLRLAIWIAGTFPFRILIAAENGCFDSPVLTQNILFKAHFA